MMSNKQLMVLFGILFLFSILVYVFAKDLLISTLGKARDGLAIIGTGTVIYWIYLLLKQ